jgi:His/Glu/Gln/Arg/opine family amino acid ABC transporter permease subunit
VLEFDLDTYLSALTSPLYVKGAFLAISAATVAIAISVVGGLTLALMRRSNNKVLQILAAGYVWIFRALPLLLVLVAVWNALPQLIPAFRGRWFNPFIAAVLGLSLTESAITGEIIRGAFSGVSPGQTEAARVLGLSPFQTLIKVHIPQVIRLALPPLGNEYIIMIKLTSLASVISLNELLAASQNDVSRTFKYAEYYGAASTYYLVIVSILMIIQKRVERNYDWKSRGTLAGGVWKRRQVRKLGSV